MPQRHSDRFATCRSGNIAGGPIGGPFSLLDETGKAVTDKDVLDKPALVYFGYASCPDVCPLDNARNVEATNLLAAKGLDVTPIFISVDPARDTPAALTEYTSYFGDKLVGLTGTPEQIRAAANAYKVYLQGSRESRRLLHGRSYDHDLSDVAEDGLYRLLPARRQPRRNCRTH